MLGALENTRVKATLRAWGSGSGTDIFSYGAGIATVRTPSDDSITNTVHLTGNVYSETGTSYGLSCDDPYISESYNDASVDAFSTYVVIEGHLLYTKYTTVLGTTYPIWHIAWSTIKWYRDADILLFTLSAGTASSNTYYTPSSIKLFGGPSDVGGVANAAYTPDDPLPESYDYEATATATLHAGWTLETAELGEVALPIVLMPLANAGAETISGIVSGTDTEDITIECYSYVRDKRVGGSVGTDGYVENWDESRGGGAHLLPNVSQNLIRLNNDYRSLIVRMGIPGTDSSTTVSQFNNPIAEGIEQGDPSPTITTNTIALNTSYGRMEEEVTNTSALLEAPFAEPTYSPVVISIHRGYRMVSLIYTIVDGLILVTEGYGQHDILTVETSFGCEDNTENPDLLGYLYHHNRPIARYWNYRHILWSCFPLFPENDETYWNPVRGTNVYTWTDLSVEEVGYWFWVRQQWCKSPGLSTMSYKRVTTMFNPLQNGRFWRRWKQLNGIGAAPWGVRNLHTVAMTPPTLIQLDSTGSSLWSITGGILIHGANMTIEPSSTSVELTLDLGSFDETFGGMYPHHALTIGQDWTDANIVSVTGTLHSSNGETAVLFTSAGTYNKPDQDNTEYATSLVYDHGVDSGVSDAGTDLNVNGISTGIMAGVETSMAFQLFPDRTAQKLVYTIELADDRPDTDFPYPSFLKSINPLRALPLTHQTSAMYMKDGTLMRVGQHRFYDYFLEEELLPADTEIAPFQYRQSAYDFLRTRDIVIYGGTNADSMTAMLEATFDTVEGQTVADVVYDTTGYVFEAHSPTVGVIGIIQNHLHCPPLLAWPDLTRNGTLATISDPFTLAANAYDWCFENQYYIGTNTIILQDGATIKSVSDTARSVHEIPVHKFNGAVSNDEYYKITSEGYDLTDCSGWFGGMAVVNRVLFEPDVISYDVSRSNLLHVVGTVSGTRLYIGLAGNVPYPLNFVYTDTGLDIDDEDVYVMLLQNSNIVVATTEAGAIQLRITKDNGATFPMSTEISPSDSKFPVPIKNRNGLKIYLYWIEGTDPYDIMGIILDNTLTVIESEFIAIADVDLERFDGMYSNVGKGGERIIIFCNIGGALTQYTSPDGINFS